MNTRVVRCGAVAAALLLSVCLTGWLLANDAPADAKVDAKVDFAATTEAIVGKDRIALLSVTRFTEFVAGDAGKGPRSVTSLRVMVLREWLGERVDALSACEVDVFASGTTDKPIRFAGTSHTTASSSNNYGGYADWVQQQAYEWSAVKLPAVKDPNLATVKAVTFQDVHVTANKADVRVRVGESVVVFSNVPLE